MIEVLDRTLFIKRLNKSSFISLVGDFVQITMDAEFEEEATALAQLLDSYSTATSLTRKSDSVERQNLLLKTLKNTAKALGDVLLLDGDDNSVKAYDLYETHIKGQYHKGIHVFPAQVKQFLDSLGDMEFDSSAASLISTLRILHSRYLSTEDDKHVEFLEIRDRLKTINGLREQIYELICVICSKMVYTDYSTKSHHANLVDMIFDRYRADLFKDFADKDEEETDEKKE